MRASTTTRSAGRRAAAAAALAALLTLAFAGPSQAQTVNAICSTDQPWCEAAAREFSKATGIKVQQMRKATGEALAQLAAEAPSGTAYTILAGLVQMMGEEPAFDYLKKLHRNTTQYTRSGNAQAPSVAKGEVAIGVSFMFTFEGWKHRGYPVVTAAPCEGTGYEIGGIALVKGARNADAARRYYDWLMGPQGQALGATVDSFQVPANKTFKPDPRIPTMDTVKLVKYDFEKYGRASERKRLIERWTRDVEALPR